MRQVRPLNHDSAANHLLAGGLHMHRLMLSKLHELQLTLCTAGIIKGRMQARGTQPRAKRRLPQPCAKIYPHRKTHKYLWDINVRSCPNATFVQVNVARQSYDA